MRRKGFCCCLSFAVIVFGFFKIMKGKKQKGKGREGGEKNLL
jgi:hypothetical protein